MSSRKILKICLIIDERLLSVDRRFINRRILKGSPKPFRVANATFKLQAVQCKAKL